MTTVTLIIEHGSLCTPDFPELDVLTRQYLMRDGAQGIFLIYRYEAGDCDLFGWPRVNDWTDPEFHNKLQSALYDAREMGHVPSHTTQALLPDGSTISF